MFLLLLTVSSVSAFGGGTRQTPWTALSTGFMPGGYSANLPITESDAKAAGYTSDNMGYYDPKSRLLNVLYGTDEKVRGLNICMDGRINPKSTFTDATTGVLKKATLDGQSYWCGQLAFRMPNTTSSNPIGDDVWVVVNDGSFIRPGNNDAFSTPSNPPYTPGVCFPNMGMHYWGYDYSPTATYADQYPFFLMYHKGILATIGWLLPSDNPSEPLNDMMGQLTGQIASLMYDPAKVPPAFYNQPYISSVHVNFGNWQEIDCEGMPTPDPAIMAMMGGGR